MSNTATTEAEVRIVNPTTLAPCTFTYDVMDANDNVIGFLLAVDNKTWHTSLKGVTDVPDFDGPFEALDWLKANAHRATNFTA